MLSTTNSISTPALPRNPCSNLKHFSSSSAARICVVSVGNNGFGGTQLTGGVLAAPTGGDEAENLDGDTRYVLRIHTLEQSGCTDDTTEANPLCEFDDLVIWISPSELLNRLVQAGRLP